MDGDARLPCSAVKRIDQARAAAPRLDGEPAPEPEAAILLLEGLAAVARLEPHALATQPAEHAVALGDELFHQVRVGAVPGEPRHVVVVVGFAVGAEIGFRELALGEVGHRRAKRLRVVEHHAHRAGGVGAVAAPLCLRRRLQQAHVRPGLRRRQRRRERSVPAAHDHDVRCQCLGHGVRAVPVKVASARRERWACVSGIPSATVRSNEACGSRRMAESFR